MTITFLSLNLTFPMRKTRRPNARKVRLDELLAFGTDTEIEMINVWVSRDGKKSYFAYEGQWHSIPVDVAEIGGPYFDVAIS